MVTSAIGIFTALKGIAAVLGVGLGAIAGPVGIVMAVMAALVAVGVLLYQNWETIRVCPCNLGGYKKYICNSCHFHWRVHLQHLKL